jgi:cytidylate kinase
MGGEIGSGKIRLAKGFAEIYGLPFAAHKVEGKAESDF